MPQGSYDMREVMGPFVAKLTFRDMCVVLKEQKGWRQVRDFFAWMKLQVFLSFFELTLLFSPMFTAFSSCTIILAHNSLLINHNVKPS